MKGRRALVTGAAGGIGRALVAAFARAGADVIGLDRRPMPEHAGRSIVVDLADEAAVASVVGAELQRGMIDTLINNAAIYPLLPFGTISLEQFRAVQAINVEAAVHLMQLLLPGMRAHSFGRVINITSITLSGQWAEFSAYVASKGALLGLTRAWAREFGTMGITVNAISPGAIPTEAEEIHPDPDAYNRFVLERQAVKRRGSRDDVARAALFLADGDTGFITGHSLSVNGGWTME